jgi:hypothetical protein
VVFKLLVFYGNPPIAAISSTKGAELRAFSLMVGGRRAAGRTASLLGIALCAVAPAVAAAEPGHRAWPSPDRANGAPPAGWGAAKAGSPVLCDANITGSVNGGLVVAPGKRYCLTGARINGSMSLAAGSGVIVKESTINGGIRSTEGATEVLICASRVNGTTTIQNGGGRILIGADADDGSTECPGNILHGGVTIGSNVAGIELEANWITGPVTLVDNEGPAFEGSAVGAEIELNHIAGPLSCASNSPAPVNDGLPNEVTGPELGQCTGF